MSESLRKLLEASNRIRENPMLKVYVNMKDVAESVAQFRKMFEEAIQAMADCFAELFPVCLDELEKLACECQEDSFDLEWQRDREREALSYDQEKARARYTAHRSIMAAHKSRQQLRRRKYRSGANAGWY